MSRHVIVIAALSLACGRVEAEPDPAGGGAVPAPDAGPVPSRTGEPGTVVAEPVDEATYLFEPTALRTFHLTVLPEDLAFIDQDPAAEAWVPATLEFEGKTYGPLKVRYKGSAGAFLRPCTAAVVPSVSAGPKTGKCSIKIGFDEVDPEGRFYGLRKLNFHSMSNDRSLLKERLGYGLFRAFGVAAPRAQHARLFINGQLEGLFVLVEQVDGRFTRARFTEGGEGNIYKEIWPIHDAPEPYLAALESNRSENPSVQEMLDFKQAIGEGMPGIDRYLDREYILRYIAADRVIMNDDGAFHWWCVAGGQGNNPGGIGNHNYYWYEAALARRLWIVPWDLDSSFAATTSFVRIQPEWRAPAECACAPLQRPPSCDPLIGAWATLGAEYEGYVDEFLAGAFAAARVDEILAFAAVQIQDAVLEAAGRGGAPDEATWQAAVDTLRATIADARLNRGFAY